MKKYILYLILPALFFGGCAVKNEKVMQKKILSPESVEIYDVSVDNMWRDIDNGRRLLVDFPFVSVKPILGFRGKFSDQFYSRIDYRYKFSALKDVDFWKLRNNPFLEDFIYVLPTWANDFKHISNDLFKDIGYTYNLSLKEQQILKWWIAQGGILWIEGGIYSTRYDTFKRNGEIDQKLMNENLMKKCRGLTFFDRKVDTFVYKAKRIDAINYKRLKLTFGVKSDIPYFKDIKSLDIVTDNYLTADFMPKGEYLVKTLKGKPLVSFIRYKKGGVVFLRPFEFENKRYDGELLRWKLLYYLLDKKYLKDISYTSAEEIKVPIKKSIVLHNLQFAYKSFQLMPKSVKLLEPVVKYLKSHPALKVTVAGHTDNIGSKRYNYKLSLNRALSVKDELIKMGIAKERISVKAYGETMPVASNRTEKGRALNRRVEFIFN